MTIDANSAGAKVLLAEDVSANIALFRAVLGKAGYQVAVAPDGAMAVEMASAMPPDIILMDIGLPKLDGLEAARRIRAAGVAAPIFALTAEDDAKTRRDCAEAGMNGYLSKPLSPVALIKTVREALGA